MFYDTRWYGKNVLRNRKASSRRYSFAYSRNDAGRTKTTSKYRRKVWADKMKSGGKLTKEEIDKILAYADAANNHNLIESLDKYF